MKCHFDLKMESIYVIMNSHFDLKTYVPVQEKSIEELGGYENENYLREITVEAS